MAPSSAQPHDRVFNFSAGPAVLPLAVLEEAAADMLNFKGCGASVMEMSHRSAEFTKIIDDAEADLRKLLEIPDSYKVYFLQGGASAQFAAIPLNLTAAGDTVDYVVTGSWSKKVRGGWVVEGWRGRAAVSTRADARPAPPPPGRGGGRQVRDRQHRGQGRQQVHPGPGHVVADAGRQVRALLRQRDDPGRRIQGYAGLRRRAARRGHELQLLLQTGRRGQVRVDLCGRTEKRRPRGGHHRHRARRPGGPRAA